MNTKIIESSGYWRPSENALEVAHSIVSREVSKNRRLADELSQDLDADHYLQICADDSISVFIYRKYDGCCIDTDNWVLIYQA